MILTETICPRSSDYKSLDTYVWGSTFRVQDVRLLKAGNIKIELKGGHHGSVVLYAPTILWPQVRISSTPSTLFLIYIVEIITAIETEMTKERK